jgi:hypothetical protein
MLKRAIPFNQRNIPEVKLFLSVVTLAVRDLRSVSSYDRSSARAFFNNDRHEPYISMIGIDPEYFQLIMDKTESYMKKRLHGG